MRVLLWLSFVVGAAGCVQEGEVDAGLDAARVRYAEMVSGVEGAATGDQVAVERLSSRSLDSQLSSLDACQVLARYESPCVLVFSGPNCGPCVTAVREFVPRLQQRGWRVHVIDEAADPGAFADCEIDAKPTFVCVRRGVECGRTVGADWRALCAMLRRANAREFSDRR